MEYDYIIYGGGPTGIFLTYLLLKNNYTVTLIEQDYLLGGCWAVKWIDDKYFSEHSPRVLSYNKNDYFFKILENEGFDFKNELVNTYGSIIETNWKLFNFFIQELSFNDILSLIKSYILHDYSNYTVDEWMNINNISIKGKKALSIFSIAVANSPKKLLISELFESTTIPNFKQFKNPEKWIQLMEQKISHANIKKNSKLIKLNYDNINNNISYGEIKTSNGIEYIYGKNHILTLPPVAFYEVLSNSNVFVKNAFINYDLMYEWMINSYYGSIGFQFHFDYDIKFKDEWCWTCRNDYQVIVLPTSKFTTNFTYDKNVKHVWSCTIVDTDAIVTKHKKEINQLQLNTIINDIVQEFNIKPYKITLYPDLTKKYNKYISKDTSFSLSKYGIIPFKSKINNLFTVGPHNKKGITIINKAVDTAVDFCKYHNMNIINDNELNSTDIIKIIIYLVIFYLSSSIVLCKSLSLISRATKPK
jgi:hypothetical protein